MGCVLMARAAALVPALLALAVSVCVAPAAAGSFNFHASADTYVDSASPKTVFGTSKRLRTNGDIPLNQTFVRFKVTGLTGTVTDAALRLYVTDGTKNGPAVFEITDSWSERTTNWKNRPSRTSTPRDDKGALSAGRWVEWDVTPWISADGTVNLSLRGGEGNRVGLDARESTRDPAARRHDSVRRAVGSASSGGRLRRRPGQRRRRQDRLSHRPRMCQLDRRRRDGRAAPAALRLRLSASRPRSRVRDTARLSATTSTERRLVPPGLLRSFGRTILVLARSPSPTGR